jgi:hypothetical protein
LAEAERSASPGNNNANGAKGPTIGGGPGDNIIFSRFSAAEKNLENFCLMPDRHYRSRIIFFADDRLILSEPAMRKPDPELLPIQCPRCPTCQMRMLTVGVEEALHGFERRIFGCRKCHRTEARLLAADPIKAGTVAGWLSGELGRQQ